MGTLMKHTNCAPQLNDTVGEICKMVQHAKRTLMHNRQELLLTYEEVHLCNLLHDKVPTVVLET